MDIQYFRDSLEPEVYLCQHDDDSEGSQYASDTYQQLMNGLSVQPSPFQGYTEQIYESDNPGTTFDDGVPQTLLFDTAEVQFERLDLVMPLSHAAGDTEELSGLGIFEGSIGFQGHIHRASLPHRDGVEYTTYSLAVPGMNNMPLAPDGMGFGSGGGGGDLVPQGAFAMQGTTRQAGNGHNGDGPLGKYVESKQLLCLGSFR